MEKRLPTSPESIGEQFEVQLECHSTPEAPPSPGESSICSFFFANHSSPSCAHNERRPSPAGSGSIYEASQASEPPEGYTDINNAALKAVLDAHITPFTQLPKTVRAELMDSTCPGAVFLPVSPWIGTWTPTLAVWPTQLSAVARSSTCPPTPLYGPCSSSTATLSTPIRRTPRYSSLIKQFILVLNWASTRGKDSTAVLQCEEGDLVVAYSPYQPDTFYIQPRPSRFPDPKEPPSLPPLTVTLSATGTMGCHTKQMRLRGVLGMERLTVRECHGRRVGWCRGG
ncbi:hypothetical protein CNBE5290 [Cryptococcus deneoformans B-3501A]|uniref:hypothetical protein n=1 Tax=Cryptococcus deneoformans (strain B-3501A) TaxID=283643 RepID=UPI000042F370|nr:hypothetical protein CNBE5290 [Cryptococcus neoformans var. neoformans B-3501A]EAL20406.1 hypothetical protein CNBE5290 [Cryptococcus neoformans var. neoformans B-3501A]